MAGEIVVEFAACSWWNPIRECQIRLGSARPTRCPRPASGLKFELQDINALRTDEEAVAQTAESDCESTWNCIFPLSQSYLCYSTVYTEYSTEYILCLYRGNSGRVESGPSSQLCRRGRTEIGPSLISTRSSPLSPRSPFASNG